MNRFETYLFDLDGTLLDTYELIYQSFLHTCRKYSGIEISRDEVKRHMGIPLEEQMALYLGFKDDDEMNEIIKTHQEHQQSIYKDTIKAFPGVIEGLKRLELKGVKIGIVSSRTRPSLDRYLKHMGIYEHFKVITTPENTINHKPHPDPVIWALKQFRSKKEETIFIGDATFDIESGKSAGVTTALVSWTHNHVDDIKVRPDYILKNFEELI